MEYKTNVMRILEKEKIQYQSYCYVDTNAVSGKEVVEVLKQDPKQVFKTLVTISKSKKIYVFLIPVLEELDLKKAAKAVLEKHLEMLKQKELLEVTGYIHGGCSPIGMRKVFPVVVNDSVDKLETMIFSAGKVGYQVAIKVDDFIKLCHARCIDVVQNER